MNRFQEALDNTVVRVCKIECGNYKEENACGCQFAKDKEVLQELIDIVSTPVCEDCEPKDLETAKFKLRYMAAETNRVVEEYKQELEKYKKALELSCKDWAFGDIDQHPYDTFENEYLKKARLDELKKRCKGDYFQREGLNLKSQSLGD